MADAASGMFLVTLEGCEDGPAPLRVLAFVRADDGPAAEASATAELTGMGWTDVRALRHGEVIDADALPDDFRSAFDTALRFGSGLIIYDA